MLTIATYQHYFNVSYITQCSSWFILTQINTLLQKVIKMALEGFYTHFIINIKPWMAQKEQEMGRDTNANPFLILSLLTRVCFVVVVVEMSYFS